MTKRHFIALADVLRGLEPEIPTAPYPAYGASRRQWEATVDALADFCQSQNPQFDRERWLGYIAGENGPTLNTSSKAGKTMKRKP